jgi:hypothetical protein
MAAFLDACRFNPAAGGTADWTYSSAVTGYQSPAAANVVNGRLYKYRAESADLSQWEIGEGAYNTSTGVLARTTVLFNSSGTTSKINFTTTPQVAVVALKEDLISVEEANSFTTTQQTQARSNIGVSAIGAAAVGQIPGTSGTTQPAAGFVGERVIGGVNCSILLTPGVWDLEASATGGGPGATSTSDIVFTIGTVNGSINTSVFGTAHYRAPAVADLSTILSIMRTRVLITANTTFFANSVATFTGSSYSIGGSLQATRVN